MKFWRWFWIVLTIASVPTCAYVALRVNNVCPLHGGPCVQVPR